MCIYSFQSLGDGEELAAFKHFLKFSTWIDIVGRIFFLGLFSDQVILGSDTASGKSKSSTAMMTQIHHVQTNKNSPYFQL